MGALSGSKHGEGGTLSQVPGRMCGTHCPRSLLWGYGWEECGRNVGKSFMTLGSIPMYQAPFPGLYTPNLTRAGMGRWCL